ncbi:MAG: flavin reductase [Clostridiales bacterium]|jgi:flavin reductase (DIM6/NTAB) family NADH-FMN oxidoreductase RutF|nr:flavin reductase [Clostridiales bacterium]
MPIIVRDAYSNELMSKLTTTGVFVTSGTPANVMTVHWGAFGTFWGKPVFVLAVRKNRYSYGLIDKSGEFAISVPRKDLSWSINKCEHVSGRECDKFIYCNLHPTAARQIKTSVVRDCGLHFECRVLFKTGMEGAPFLNAQLKSVFYKDAANYHTWYFAEVVEAYEL